MGTTQLLEALTACTEAVRELLALLRPPGDVDSYPGGRIGWAIYRARMARNWNPGHLARLVGVSRSSIIAWELGRAHPSPRRWGQLIALFPELKGAGTVEDGRVVEDIGAEEAADASR